MTDEELEIAAADGVKFVKRAMVFTGLAVAVAAAVLLIDQGIKRAVLDAAASARRTLDEFNTRVDVMTYGRTEEAQAGRAAPVPGRDSGNGVVHDAAAGTVLGEAPDPVGAPQDGVEARAE